MAQAWFETCVWTKLGMKYNLASLEVSASFKLGDKLQEITLNTQIKYRLYRLPSYQLISNILKPELDCVGRLYLILRTISKVWTLVSPLQNWACQSRRESCIHSRIGPSPPSCYLFTQSRNQCLSYKSFSGFFLEIQTRKTLLKLSKK